ncbi:MAG: glycosyl hydrolase [Planctomycetes bacterium]|nr:glycosyl hydrolase [Planctomycetota bacterium]
MPLIRAVLAFLILWPLAALAQDPPPKGPDGSAPFGGLKLRSIGPAITSGRIAAFAVHPTDTSIYYVAVASGGVWKTINAGTTWSPIFDKEGSYSIGAIALDPKNPQVVWVGAGENNSQRSVSYGDGVYRSDDAGKSWKNVGLKSSEHIGRILIDPRNSDVVYVAAQGPLWNAGGERGLYKTTDAGKTWKQVLKISENTGVTDVVLDPRNPDVLIAASYQRRRHVWTLINGGPESAIYKSTDGGGTWKKLKAGLPSEDLGRISLAIAPTNPDIVYAGVESIDKKGGVFRSADLGETWERRNDFDQGAMYFAGVAADPKNADRVYVMGVFMQVSDDGGKTLRRLGQKWRHVDDHAIWINPTDTRHYRVGCDGGIYESFDQGANWTFMANLPVTQFYDVTCDESGPFYHVYGGTQDNFTLGGPARTRSAHGITNADWFVTLGGDGFHSRVDSKDPNTVYSTLQYGVLSRFDRRTGQSTIIQPQVGKDEPPLRWNWDSPLIISPHKNTRLYFAANRLFKSADRGDSWKPVSGDLTRQLDRDKLPVMGKLWGPDAVAKHQSTSFYGNCIALSESPKKEGLIYVGTDDGLVQVTEDGGKNWRKIDTFPGVPDQTYVTRLLASQHETDTVYLAFDNHKNGDFAPYLLKSTDAGQTWTSIKSDLPERGSVLAIAEDHVNPNLLFAGTEFGLYFTLDGGKKWTRLKGGLPTIAVKDLAIQRQMNDLVVGTFGRGIYVLDDYSPLRELTPEALLREAVLCPVRDATEYIPTRQYGVPGKGFQGSAFYTADNPPFGATFTYHLKDTIKSEKQKRRDLEKEATKKGATAPYPSKDQLRAEAEEEAPAILLTISDTGGKPLRTLTGPATQGIQRVAWDLREPAPVLPKPPVKEGDEDIFVAGPQGPLVLPGTYRVSLAKRVGGTVTPLGEARAFKVVLDGPDAAATDDRKELHDFQQKVLRLQRAVAGALETANELTTRLERIKRTLDHTPNIDVKWKDVARDLEKRNREIMRALRGDVVLRARDENTPPSISERVGYIVSGHRNSLARPTQTQRDSYDIASKDFARELARLRTLIESDLRRLQEALHEGGAPWIPGLLPAWKEK